MRVRLWVGTAATALALAAILFGAAGTLRWPAGWAFLILFFGAIVAINLMLMRHDPALVAERMKPPIQKGQPLWDRVWIISLQLLFVGWIGLMGLDAGRLHWSRIPAPVECLGGLGLMLAMWLWYLTFRANTFAAAVVRIQTERGHKVVSTGPYSIVRHPMYGSAILLFISAPLLVGSAYALLWSLLLVALLIVRTILEDRELSRRLYGYSEYAQRVRYRLIPRIW